MKKGFFVVVLCWFLGIQLLEAEVRLPKIIQSGMVLQQQSRVPIWGWANPGETLAVYPSWGKKKQVSVQPDGKWQVHLRTPKAGGPFSIRIEGSSTIELTDVLIGEVWFCSGQSNMEFSLQRTDNAQEAIKNANYPAIRLFKVGRNSIDKPVDDCKGSWTKCTPESVGLFSGVAYHFGQRLHQGLNVPVGLIQSAWGGSAAEAWVPREVLLQDERLHPIVNRFDSIWVNKTTIETALAKWEKDKKEAKAKGESVPKRPYEPLPREQHRPEFLYNGMVHPVIPFAIKGVIWYQGERNRTRAYQYRTLFPTLIKSWRQLWGQDSFPFYYVQIAPFSYGQPKGTEAAELREAQLLSLSVPKTGMVVTTDIGNVKDIHPTNKKTVGERLALWALANDYGDKNLVFSGPVYKSMNVENEKIRIFFKYTAEGLKGEELTHFLIAGLDKKFVPAKAYIEGHSVVVYNPDVKEPVAVRFGFSNAAEPNLFNSAGLPASPFRTDDWPGVTYEKY